VLVIGTSLEVFSAFRFVNRANDLQKPIAIINHGETRAERKMLSNIVYKSDENCAELLKLAVTRL
jgi:NAD-dependent SIR2 family protein deacetylase